MTPRLHHRPRSKGAYHVYGVRLDSAWPLPYPRSSAPSLARVSLREGSERQFEDALKTIDVPLNGAPWVSVPLPDGSRYLRWSGVFEFLIKEDGRSVLCRLLGKRSADAFHTHLGPSLSFALIHLGVEPLHSTTVIVDGGAVALMGDCGYGKSSLGAEFLKAGHALLTDDLLVLEHQGGRFTAYPGAPRIKLFPAIAKAILGPKARGLKLKHLTPKVIIPLTGDSACQTTVPLKAIYVLRPPDPRTTSRRVSIRRLSARQAFIELVRNTFNMAVTDPGRLERQFALATALALNIPVKSLSYPRRLSMLAAAREAILTDLAR